MDKMDKEVKQKWIDALRSGKYQQIKGALKSENGFCCLGVLCDIYAREKNIEWKQGGEYKKLFYLFERNFTGLQDEICQWAGLPIGKDVILKDKLNEGINWSNTLIHYTLIYYNDNANKTFEEIADIIEREL